LVLVKGCYYKNLKIKGFFEWEIEKIAPNPERVECK
jgi:hypothetical protein